jgi:tRNA (guanine37-N1)-methyltransferase
MINFHIMTLFPEIIDAYKNESILKRAAEANLISISSYNIRDFSEDKHKKVDDYPYSGGGGMIMTPQPIFSAYEHIKKVINEKSKCIYMSPQGRILNNDIIKEYSMNKNTIILCGHYEGIDQRVIDALVDDEISIGDYVLTGGELPALVFTDAVSRSVEGVLSTRSAFTEESHYNGLLEYPQYTRPYDYKGMKVPEILLCGHEANINKWKRLMSIRNTREKRPDIDISRFVSIEEIKESENIDNLFTHK